MPDNPPDYRDKIIAHLERENYSLRADLQRQKTMIAQLVEERNEMERRLGGYTFQSVTSVPAITY